MNPNMNNTETSESIPRTEVSRISMPTSSTLIRGITVPVQSPTETMRSNTDNLNDPHTSEKFTVQDNPSAVTSHQFQNQNTATSQFFHFN